MAKRQIIPHTQFEEALDRIRECHESAKDDLGKEHLKVLGPAGSGKTTVLKDYAANHQAYEVEDRTVVPVVYARIPPRPTIRKVASAVLRAMGSEFADKGDEQARTHQLVTLLGQCRTELLLLDELQHLVDRGQARTHALIADWIKELSDAEEFHGSIVLAGLTRSRLLDAANEQFARRFSSEFLMGRFDPTTVDGVDMVRGVLEQMYAQLEFNLAPGLDEADVGKRMAFASDGIMGYIVKQAVEVKRSLRRTGGNAAGLPEFSAAFRNTIWADAPGERNPFVGKGVNTRLTAPGEPFAPDAASSGWDD